MRRRSKEVERLRRFARRRPEWAVRHNKPGFCSVCQEQIVSALDVHMINVHLELGQLWRCPAEWCAIWKGSVPPSLPPSLNLEGLCDSLPPSILEGSPSLPHSLPPSVWKGSVTPSLPPFWKALPPSLNLEGLCDSLPPSLLESSPSLPPSRIQWIATDVNS